MVWRQESGSGAKRAYFCIGGGEILAVALFLVAGLGTTILPAQDDVAQRADSAPARAELKSYLVMPEPPLGYSVTNHAITMGRSPQPMPGDHVIVYHVLVENQRGVNCAAGLMIDLMDRSTEAKRREGVEAGIFGTKAAAERRGFKLRDSNVPNPADVDVNQPIISSFDFETKDGGEFLVRKRLTFVDAVGYSVSVTSDDREALKALQGWTDEIHPIAAAAKQAKQEHAAADDVAANSGDQPTEGEQFYLKMPEPPAGYSLAKTELTYDDELIGYALSLSNTKGRQAGGVLTINFGDFSDEALCRQTVRAQIIAPEAGAMEAGFEVVASKLPDPATCDLKQPIDISYDFKSADDGEHYIRKRLIFTSIAFNFDVSSTSRDDVELLAEWASRIRPASSERE